MRELLFLVSILLVMGCATGTKIEVNGGPAGSNLLIVRNNEFNIYAHAHRHFIDFEDKESLMMYEPIVFEDVVQLPLINTLALSVVLRVANESREHYQLWECYVLTDHGGKKTYRINKLYEGRLSMKEFKLLVPIRGYAKGKYALKMANANGKLMFVVGTVRFKWEEVIAAE
jgi:hypothetical protein